MWPLLNTSMFDNVSVTTGSATQPPATPTSPTPTNGATGGLDRQRSLTWSAIGRPPTTSASARANPPPAVASALAAATYRPPSMNAGTTYYWQVLARNSAGTRTGPCGRSRPLRAQTGGLRSVAVGESGHRRGGKIREARRSRREPLP